MTQKDGIRDFSLTKAALATHDKALAAFKAKLDKDITGLDQELVKDLHNLEKLEILVGESFGYDTNDINSVDTCRECVRPGDPEPSPGFELSFVRRMVRDYHQITTA